MTVTREDLLRAALASTDDTERLVYADWLEQHGEVARAQVIHLQCELAKTEKHDRRRVELQWLLDDVLSTLGANWKDELPVLDGVEWIAMSRGFASAVRVRDVQTLCDQAAAIRAAAPTLDTVELARLEWVDEIPDMPWLRLLRVRGDMTSCPALMAMPAEIELYLDEYDGADVDRDEGRPLQRLMISGTNEIGEALAAQLVEAEWAKELKSLSLPTRWENYDTGYGPANDPRLGDDGARSLAQISTLEELNVDRQVTTKPLERLLAMPAMRDLSARECGVKSIGFGKKGALYERLDLSLNPIGNGGAAQIARAYRLGAVQRLELDTCEIEAAGLAELTKSPLWQTLRYLDVSRNPLGIGGVRTLADAAVPEELHTLRIADADLDEAAGNALGKISWLGRLTILDIGGNQIGRGAACLRAIEAEHLRELDICAIGLERTEAAALARFWPKLIHLDISNNYIGDAGLERFVMREAPALQTLKLRNCKIGSDGLELLAERAKTPRLRVLDLHDNKLEAAPLAALLRSPMCARLEALVLSKSSLSADVIEMLASTPMPPKLQRLDLRDNVLHEPMLVALANSPSLKAVPVIRLSGNPWGFSPAVREKLEQRFGTTWYQDES